MSSRYLIPLAVVAALSASAAANAWELDSYPGQSKGDWIFRLGVSDVNPQNENLALKNALGKTTGYLVVDQDVSLSGTVTYMVTDHIGTELLLAYPFTHGLDLKVGKGPQRIGHVDQLPPTLSVQWHFNPDGVIRPYIGVGVNWTMFSDETLKGGLDSYGTSLSMDDSFGGAGQIGADFMLNEHWLINADVRYIGITSKAKITDLPKDALFPGSNPAHANVSADVDINPIVYTLAVGYRWGAPPPPPPPVVAPPPPPPPPAPAPAAKCGDADGDGVCDEADKCPGTPAGTKVDTVGCPLEQTLKVLFGFDSAELTPESITELERVVKFMNDVPFATAEIDGHTDSVGSDAYNMGLSDRRAKSVFDYLSSRGIDPARLKSKGFGETTPIADNQTAEGRAENRRVMLIRTDTGG